MSEQNNLAMKTKKNVRKIRFGIVLKLSLFVISIQIIVLISLGTIFVDKEAQTLRKNIHYQVSSMLTNFRENLITTARRINEITLNEINNPQPRNGRINNLSGNEFISLNNILKKYTDAYSSEDETSGKFKVSEIMAISPDGWVISHSRDDRWVDQHHKMLIPLAGNNGISDKDLIKLDNIIFDSIPNEMESKVINSVNYFKTAFPVFYYDQSLFRNTPALINSVDNFQLLYKKFINNENLSQIKFNKDIHNALIVFDKILNETYNYIEITKENEPVKLTKLGEEIIKLNLFNMIQLNYLKLTSDTITRYVRQKWLYTILFKDEISSIILKINDIFDKKVIDNFVQNIEPSLKGIIANLENAVKAKQTKKVKTLIEKILSTTISNYDELTENFPSIGLMNEVDEKIRVFIKEVGEARHRTNEQYYRAGLEPYDTYLKPFRDKIVEALNIINEQNWKNTNLDDTDFKKILEIIKKAFEDITITIPQYLKAQVLTPIKISLMKYTLDNILDIRLVTNTVSILKSLRHRLSTRPVNQIADAVNKIIGLMPETLRLEFVKILNDKKLQEIQRQQTRRRIPLQIENNREEQPKEYWDVVKDEITNNIFFRKTIKIVGEKTNTNLSESELLSLPFYAMLFKVRQNWRSFSGFDEIPLLKNKFTDADRKFYIHKNNRLAIIQRVYPFLRKKIAEQLLYREIKIPDYQANAIRSMHPFSIGDIARLYPYSLSIKNYIYNFDNVIKNKSWENYGIIKDDKFIINTDFIQKVSASMMRAYKLGYIVLRVKKGQYDTFLRKARNTTTDYSISILLRSIFLSIVFSTIFLKSLKILTQAAEEIGQGNLDKTIKLKGTDEFGQLADTLNNMAFNLKIAYEEIKDKARMEEELKVAQGIQEMLLPKETPNIPGYSFAGYYKAQTQIGGDYYDYLTDIGKDHFGLVVADVSGHGVGAGIVMTMIRSVLRTEAIQKGKASTVIKNINPMIHRDTSSSMYATLWYGIINTATKVLNYTVAGHNPAIIYNPDKKNFNLLKTGGMPVGLVDNSIFTEAIETHLLQLHSGDILIQYTDGVTEAMNKNQEEYGEERFFSCIKKMGNVSAEKIVQLIVDDIEKFTGGIDQSDDITLLVMKVE